MNKAKLKTYAPQARKDFIAAVVARANLLGIAESAGGLDIAPSEKKGDVALIAGQAWPAKVHEQRMRLIKRIRKTGFAETMEAVAYTWFNRVAALRYMEIHDYLGHGHRVLSSREGGLPEIIAHAGELCAVLPGLTFERVAEMKLAGNKDGELYRLLLVAQCNALANVMPFLFERIDDESELLLPGNLERTDSVVAKLVEAIPEEDWSEVEIIGWLYQFYISEKKDQVIGKVVKTEDIPAATQLFTPNWIVQYLVQNSVGRLWMMANPTSTLKSQWPYYIEPAEQTPEVQAQLDALIQTRMAEDGGSLNPETITVLDPACGSGHILVEAYEVLKGIYLERGYQPRSIPRLILDKNLYGLDIDDRAAQLAGFALLMKARADDRRLLDSPIMLNVLSLQERADTDLDEFAGHLKPHGINRTVLGSLLDTFTHAKTFGSLIQIPKLLEDGLGELEAGIAKAIENGDVFAKAAAQDLVPLVQQARVLAMKFDAVVANPPYMSSKGMDSLLKKFARDEFADSKSDLFACFIERGYTLSNYGGYIAMVTMQSWMSLSSFESMRERMLREKTIITMAHLGPRGFAHASAMIVQTTAFVLNNRPPREFRSTYFRLLDGDSEDKRVALQRGNERYERQQGNFGRIPGSPLAYWLSQSVVGAFETFEAIEKVAAARQGMATGDNGRFVRLWHEVSITNLSLGCKTAEEAWRATPRWVPFNKGGETRKWYGNQDHVLSYSRRDYAALKAMGNHCPSEDLYFQPSISWSKITGTFGVRYFPEGFVFADAGMSIFCGDRETLFAIGALLNSNVATMLCGAVSPTLNFEVGVIRLLPFISSGADLVSELVNISRHDWDSFESSWCFQKNPLTSLSTSVDLLSESYNHWCAANQSLVNRALDLERESNKRIIERSGLDNELTPDVPIAQITLTVNPVYRYGGNLSESEQWVRFRHDTIEELVSYAIGCMLGRYSLDEPGLIYAHAGNIGFDATRYKIFPADADGIVPLTDELWFEDDATTRVREFLKAVWGPETLDENMAWLAESLGTKSNETADETVRRYLAGTFFKDHLQTYKKRPIYWLFSSGKQGAFQALVYLHRYHEGTLARMRAEYVVPLTGKMQSRIEMLEKDRDVASSTAARNKIAKQIESLKKKHVELLAYDEKLRHYADMRIQLDLDDGVKVNYGKFGDLLAEVKTVTGGTGDE